MNGGIDAFILRELADDAGIVLAGVVDAQKIGSANPVGDGAQIGIAGDAAGEFLASVFADADFAQKLRLDLESVVFTLAPRLLVRVHGIGEGDDAVLADGDRYQPADGPEFGEIGLAEFGHGGNGRARAGAGDDPAEHAVSGLVAIPAVLLSGGDGTVQIVVQQDASLWWVTAWLGPPPLADKVAT